MELKKLAPWNWFKNEEEIDHPVPVRHPGKDRPYPGQPRDPMEQFHHGIDRLFDEFFRGFDLPIWKGIEPARPGSTILRPKVDLSATESAYLLSVEIPGVSEKEVSVEVRAGAMIIKGEKKQEKEEKTQDYYRIERSYGAFQRVLSLPEDVDQEGIKAEFKNGVLSITMPRRPLAKGETKQIKISAAE